MARLVLHRAQHRRVHRVGQPRRSRAGEFAVAFIAALGDRDNTLLGAGMLGVAMAVVSVVVFWWLLQLQLPLFQWN